MLELNKALNNKYMIKEQQERRSFELSIREKIRRETIHELSNQMKLD